MGSPIEVVLVVVGLGLLPLLAVAATAFVKIAVVLGLLRNAIGAKDVPPTLVVTAVALLLTLVVMAPVGADMAAAARPAIDKSAGMSFDSPDAAAAALEAGTLAAEPVRTFLGRHAHARDRALFLDLSQRLRPAAERDAVKADDLLVLAPAFVTSELKEAFTIGFLLFLPFLVIDLLVATVLASLGLRELQTAQVALPFKLLLFVLVDGWALLARGLILGYA